MSLEGQYSFQAKIGPLKDVSRRTLHSQLHQEAQQ